MKRMGKFKMSAVDSDDIMGLLSEGEAARVNKASRTEFLCFNSMTVAEQIVWVGDKVELNALDLINLVCLCHGWMLGLHNKPLIDEPVEAWTYGPVVPSIYYFHKYWGILRFRDRSDKLFPVEIELIKEVVTEYSDCTTSELSNLARAEGSPWDTTRLYRGIWEIIPNQLFEDFYRKRVSTEIVDKNGEVIHVVKGEVAGIESK